MRNRLRLIFVAGVLATLGISAPVAAQPDTIEVDADEEWVHQWTGLRFPVRLAELERNRVTQFEDRESNIGVNYTDDANSVIVSLYVYRAGDPNVAIWFDRGLTLIGFNEMLGEVNRASQIRGTFVPSGGTSESGAYAVMPSSGQFRSTALALYRSGDWLIKARISARRLSVQQLRDLTLSVFSNFQELESVGNEPIYIMRQCSTSLSDQPADPVETGEVELSAFALEASAIAVAPIIDGLEETAPEPVRYCRVGEGNRQYAVYRPIDDPNQYLVALSDSGRQISVVPGQELGGLLAVGNDRQVYTVSTVTALETTIHRPFAGMPTLEQAAEVAFRQSPIARVSRPLGDENASIEIITGGSE